MSTRVHKYLSRDFMVRASVVIATDLIEEMRKRVGTYPIATVVSGRALIGTILMASQQKQGHRVGMYIRGTGPLGTIYTESTFEGIFRSYVQNPQVDLPMLNGQMDIRGAVGNGILEVVRDLPLLNTPHVGRVELQTGEVGDDIAYYLATSQQTRSVVALGVEQNLQTEVTAAGGVLIELLPDAGDDVVKRVEEGIRKANPIPLVIYQGGGEKALLDNFLPDFDMMETEHPYELEYSCRCSKDRIHKTLLLLSHDDVQHLLEKQEEPVLISCDFCRKQYDFTLKEIEALLSKSFRNSLN